MSLLARFPNEHKLILITLHTLHYITLLIVIS